jgi:hypothetical protein
MLEGMEPKWERREWLLLALWMFFPLLHHPWWLALISIAVYLFLVWLVLRRRENPKENSN